MRRVVNELSALGEAKVTTASPQWDGCSFAFAKLFSFLNIYIHSPEAFAAWLHITQNFANCKVLSSDQSLLPTRLDSLTSFRMERSP